jgi:hypothetical protein
MAYEAIRYERPTASRRSRSTGPRAQRDERAHARDMTACFAELARARTRASSW